jgi:DNA-binding MarR family transcriptional regulator
MTASPLRRELGKRNAFDSPQQEAMLSVLKTSDLLENRLARLLREYDLTPSQYNVLRILRGENQPMPMLEVAGRMIQVVPAITRVVDQLVRRDLISKQQCSSDRRVYLVAIRPVGRKLLSQLDQPILDLHQRLMKGLPPRDLQRLTAMLARLRAAVD